MKRRDALLAIALSGSGLAIEGCTARTTPEGEMTDAELASFVKVMTGIVVKPEQMSDVREVFNETRFKGNVDPHIQPSLMFDPEVNVE